MKKRIQKCIAFFLVCIMFCTPLVSFADEESTQTVSPQTEAAAGPAVQAESKSDGIAEVCTESTEKQPETNTDSPDLTETFDSAIPVAETEPDCICENEQEQAEGPSEDSGTVAAKGNPVGASYRFIGEAKVESVKTNPDYSSFEFSFENTKTNEQYHCFITGLVLPDNVKAEDFLTLQEAIAESFLNGSALKISSSNASEEFGIEINCIDAEKESSTSSVYGDSNLCWAASASDLYEFCGWNDFENEDELFGAFVETHTNVGASNLDEASEWYFNGINPKQAKDTSGNITFDEEIINSPAYQNTSQVTEENSGAYESEYYSKDIQTGGEVRSDGIESLFDVIKNIVDGFGAGICVAFQDGFGNYYGAHALSIFGFIEDLAQTGIDAIKSLFITDSDNDAKQVSPDTDREDRENSITMYELEEDVFSGAETVSLVGYKNTLHTTVYLWESVLPKSLAEDHLETEGTKNPVQDVDLNAKKLKILDENGVAVSDVKTGNTVTLSLQVDNTSYVNIKSGSSVAYTVVVYKNGVEYETIDGLRILKRVLPNGSFVIEREYTFEEPGEYTFEYRIDEMYDSKNNPVQEAYTINNSLKIPVSITVKDEPVNPPASKGTEDTYGEIFRASFTREQEKYSIPFTPETAVGTVYKLLDRETGEEIAHQYYSIERQPDGTYLLNFTEDFIRTLLPGTYNFVLVSESCRIYFEIEFF